LVSATGVDGEATEESVLTVDGQGEVSRGDEDSLAGQATVDANDEVTPTDVTSFVDRVDAGPDRSIDGRSRSGRAAGRPPFGRCGTAQGSMRPGLVVVVSPPVELVLEFADGPRRWLDPQPGLGGLMRTFEFAAGLGVSRSRADLDLSLIHI